MTWKLIGTVGALSLVLVLSINASPGLRSGQESPAASGSPGSSGLETSAEHRVVVQDAVEVRCTVSLAALVTSSSGAHVRPFAATSIYVAGQTLLGSQHGLTLLPVDGSEPISDSIQGLDLRLANPQLSESAAIRSYRVTIRPRAGFTWSSVTKARTDIAVTVDRID
jgi:hypothetical protein